MAKKDRTGNRKKRDQRKQFKVPELGYYFVRRTRKSFVTYKIESVD